MGIVSVRGNVKAGCDLSIGEKTLIVGPNGCHRKGQPILMADGAIKAVEDVVVGDKLAAPDGEHRTVLQLCRGSAPMFTVKPIKGDSFVVNGDHILTLVACADIDRGTREGATVDVTVNEWLTWPEWKKNLWKLFRSAAVFTSEEGWVNPAGKLPVYFLGALLGDGGLQSSVCIHKPDREIEDAASVTAIMYGLRTMPIVQRGQVTGWRLSGARGAGENPLTADLKILGLWGCTAGEKFVPDYYKKGPMHVRLDLLSGLLDTDGSLNKGSTTFDYISKSKQLAEDVVFLARSVGLSAYMKPKKCRAQTGAEGIYWRVCIGGQTWIVPTRIPRKQAKAWPEVTSGRRGGYKDGLRTGLSIEPTGTVEDFYGFTLDGDGRFLLGDFTVTHNSGKSSIVNTVELALTGRASDIAGRVDVAREVDVMSLATNGAGELEALVTFQDGMVAAYRTSGSTAKAKKATGDKPVEYCHEDVLPIRSLKEALLGSPATARKYLLGKMSEGVTIETARVMVDIDVYGAFDRLMQTFRDMSPADALIAGLEETGSRARELASKAKAAKQAATFVTGGAAVPPSPAEIEEAKKAAAQLQNAYAEAVAANARSGNLPYHEEEVTRLAAMAEAAVAAFQEAKAALDALAAPELPATMSDALLSVAKESVEKNECLVCGNPEIAPVAEVLEQVNSLLAGYEASKKAYNAALTRQARAERAAEDAIGAYENATERLEREKAMVAEGGAEIGNPEEIRAQYEKANAHVNELQNRRSAWDTAHKAQKQAVAAEEEAEEWNKLKDALAVVVEKLVDNALSSFIAKVQANLPPTDTFSMILRDGDREVVKFGLVRDGQLHTALSGAEWARVMAALADACVPDGRYACIIPEERAFDALTLASVMKALNNSKHQVILTSPIAPKSPPKNWTIIKRGEE